MATFSSIHILFFVFITSGTAVFAIVFTLENICPYTVWPGIFTSYGPELGEGGFPMTSGASVQLTTPAGWSGRLWARTGCNFDASGEGKCVTGDCGGLNCNSSGDPPVSLAEFVIGVGGRDSYDLSLVDGYNVKLGIRPYGGFGECKYAGCDADLNQACPDELKVMDLKNNVVACKSACEVFNTDQYCCRGAYDSPQTCPPTNYSIIFKKACPYAYSYAYDDDANTDNSNTFTCTGTNYLITFCPMS